MFGDGSNGPLNVTSGTHNLALNTKHQFTSVNIAAGATLSTASTSGAVLYILARESITIDGDINLEGKVIRGNNSWSVILDGTSYSSPGVAAGAYYSSVGQSGTGFGSGGAGVSASLGGITYSGGSASQGGASPSGGGGAPTSTRSTNGQTGSSGTAGSQSAGGGGASYAYFNNGGAAVLQGQSVGTGGAGGSSHGANGANGSGSFTNWNPGAGIPGHSFFGGGGGGAGGAAGRSGVHVVLKAPVIIINGQIITAGTDGGVGGNGGRAYDTSGATNTWGAAGLGGGGGRGGNVTVVWANSLANSGTQDRSGGSGAAGGYGGTGFVQAVSSGVTGGSGSYSTSRITDPSLYASDLTAGTIASAEAIGTHTFIPDPLNLTAGTIAGGEVFPTDHVITLNVAATTITSAEAFSTDGIVTQSPPPPPPPTDWEAVGREDQKTYVYRVYSASGTFMGTWVDVEDVPMFTQKINTPGTTMTVQLNRSPNTTKEVIANLITQAGDTLQTEDAYDLVGTYETNNSVGAGTDVDINLNVDVYVHYGEFNNLITQAGDTLITEAGDFLIAASGSPTGKRIFSGFILDYESLYGEKNGVTVTLASHGAELSQALVRSGSDVVVNYTSQELSTTLKSVLDTNPGKMTYSVTSIENTGVSAAFKFQLNTKLEAVNSIYGQSPEDFYWYGDVATNEIVLREKSATPDHMFKLGHHIKEMSLKRSQEQLRNQVYFVGAESGGTSILKKYEDTTSQTDWRVGLHRITDRRYSVAANMQRRADKEMAAFKGPIFTTTVTISAAKYDIETIKLGHVVGFLNSDNFLKDLQLQVMSRSYTPTGVTLQIGGLLDTQADIINDIGSSIENEQFQSIPNAPS